MFCSVLLNLHVSTDFSADAVLVLAAGRGNKSQPSRRRGGRREGAQLGARFMFVRVSGWLSAV